MRIRKIPILRIIPALLAGLLAVSSLASAAQEWKTGKPSIWKGLPAAAAPYLVDLNRDGLAEAIVLQEGTCQVYRAGGLDAFEPEATISMEDKKFSSAYADDLDRDGRVELLLGTDDLGYLVVYRWVEGPEYVTTSRHTWKTVQNIVVLDADGDGSKDVFSIAPDGDVTLFRFSGSSLDPIWRGSKAIVGGRIFRTAQLDGAGPEEIVLVDRTRGGIAAYSWKEGSFSKVWESFPWGGVLDCAVGDFDGDNAADILAVSGRRLLYSFTSAGGSIVEKWKPLELPALCSFILSPLDSPGTLGLVSSSSQVLVFSVSKNGAKLNHRSEPLGRPFTAQMLRNNEIFLVTQTGETVSQTIYSQERIDVQQGGRLVRWQHAPLVREGRVYVPVGVVAPLLGLTYGWDEQVHEGILTSEVGAFVFRLDSPQVATPENVPVDLAAPPIRINDEVYVPLELIELILPGRVVFNENRLLLVIQNG